LAGAGGNGEGSRALIAAYLAPDHRDEMDTGCAAAALAGDVAREPADSPIRAAFAAGLEHLVGVLGEAAPEGAAGRRQEAVVLLATLVGAITLARATRGEAIGEEMLETARRALEAAPRMAL
jgi:TetR/AcrR family transcriptional regulator, transcriptional repressor for nem operon